MSFSFSDLVFKNETHSYTYEDQELVSVTTLKGQVVPPFDKDGVSMRVAARDGKSQEEVLAEWDEKGSIALDKGTRVHEYIEDKLKGIHDPILWAVNGKLPEMHAFDDAWKMMTTNLNAKPVHLEYVVGDPDLGLAGMIDNIMEIQKKRSIFDWKTGKYEISSPYERLYPPFEDLSSCQHSQYSIQTSLYRFIYEKYVGELGDSYLLHLRPDGSYQLHRAIDLRDRIEPWLDGKTARDLCGDPKLERQAKTLASAIGKFMKTSAGKLTTDTRGLLIETLKDAVSHTSPI